MAVRRSALPISVELTESTVVLWEFLKLVDNYPWLYEGLHVHNAVRRYEIFWLPLVSKIDPRYPLAAPLDIEWVWYVHMLSPYAYNRDCLHRFGHVIDHRITTAKDRNIGLNNAREIWKKAYPQEEFSLDLTAPPKITDTFTSKFSYDLFAAIFRQRFFNYQVALNHYRDSKFLGKATKRYKDFLRAKLQDPSLVLNGCFDVQIVWHAHLVHPIYYRDDTRKIFGEMLSYYDSEAGSGIVAWSGSPVREKSPLAPKSIPGSMYRGEAILCTREQILLTQNLEQLTLKVKLFKEDFSSPVLASTLRSRDLMLTPCWFEIPSLSLACFSQVMNIAQGKSIKKYDVKVLHSLAPVLSAVEVSHPKGYLVATAHTIAGKQIPMKSQLGEVQATTCAYIPEARERAMLIRSQKDWGVCVGRWAGNSESGQLVISFFNLQTNKWHTVNQSNSANAEFGIYEVNIFDEDKSVFVNLGAGEVSVPYTDIATFLPEIITLAYCISILYVLCRERTREFYPVKPFLSNEMKSIQPCPLSKEVRASRVTKRDGIFSASSNRKKSMWLNRDPYVSNILLASGRNCVWAPSNSFLKFFEDNVRGMFESCLMVSEDDKSSMDARLEIESSLEYLGITCGKESPSKKSKEGHKAQLSIDSEGHSQGKRGHSEGSEGYEDLKSQHKKEHKTGKSRGNNELKTAKNNGVHFEDEVELRDNGGFKATRDRFSNVQINDKNDGRGRDEHNDNESVFV